MLDQLPDELMTLIMSRLQSLDGETRVVEILDESVSSCEILVIKSKALRSLACTTMQAARLLKPLMRSMAKKIYVLEVPPHLKTEDHLVFVEFKNTA